MKSLNDLILKFKSLSALKRKVIYSTLLLLLFVSYCVLVVLLLIMFNPSDEAIGMKKFYNTIAFIYQNYSLNVPYIAIKNGYIFDVIKSSIISLIIVYGLTIAGTLSIRKNNERKNVHGKASWSSDKDIEKANLTSKDGIIVGRSNKGQLYKFGGQEFVSTGAPTRSGKGVGIVIPNLLEWENSLVVLDVKQECFDITSKYRQDKLNQKVYLFNPFSFNTHRYNPLDYLDFSKPDIELQIQALAVSLYPSGKGGKDFFVLQAQAIFVAIVYLFGKLRENYLLDASFTLTTLAGALQGVKIHNGNSESERFELIVIVDTAYNLGFLTETIYSKFQSFFEQAEAADQFTGIKASYETPLKVFQDPLFEMATSCNDFDFRKLRKEKMTIYIGITPENIEVARPIVNLLFTQLIYENIRQGLPDTTPELKHNVLMLMDEFTSIGFMQQYQTAIAYMAGYNLRSLIIYQNRTQLAEELPRGYGDKGAETLLENHACNVIYRPKNPKVAEDISKRIGNITTSVDNRSFNSKDLMNVSRSQNTTQRALILPQEIMDLKDDEEIIFYNSVKIKCKKAFFYSDPYFINKLKSVSPSLKKIDGLPTKKDLEAAYSNKETSIPLPTQKNINVNENIL